MKKWFLRHGTQGFLRALARLARLRGAARRPAERMIEALGATIARARGIAPDSDPAALGATWQRAFPSKKQVPIVAVDHKTAYGEIHTPCPLRGTGDVGACYRMMGYDRAFMKRAGARFVVIESQAEPNVTICKIAIRRSDLPADDLIPAHLRGRRH